MRVLIFLCFSIIGEPVGVLSDSSNFGDFCESFGEIFWSSVAWCLLISNVKPRFLFFFSSSVHSRCSILVFEVLQADLEKIIFVIVKLICY